MCVITLPDLPDLQHSTHTHTYIRTYMLNPGPVLDFPAQQSGTYLASLGRTAS